MGAFMLNSNRHIYFKCEIQISVNRIVKLRFFLNSPKQRTDEKFVFNFVKKQYY